MKTLYKNIYEILNQKEALVEVTIIEHNGSTPRTAGAKMLVRQDKSILGTIGGGLYEAKAINMAYTMHVNAKENAAFITYFDLKGSAKPTDMDMVCGGDLRLLLEFIQPTKENIELYKELLDADCQGDNCILMTRIEPSKQVHKINSLQERVESSSEQLEDQLEVNLVKALLFKDDKAHKSKGLGHLTQDVKAYLDEQKTSKIIKNYSKDNCEYVFEKIEKKYTLYLFGAGHVSCELAKISSYLDFTTIALDDRAEFANPQRFPSATTVVLPSLEEEEIAKYLQSVNISEKDGIVILTRGHARDRDVLAAALKTKPGYFGMIGSKTKRQSTYAFLLENGYNEEDFKKIHSPIGLNIGAQTPEEIAISICAELIQWRAGVL